MAIHTAMVGLHRGLGLLMRLLALFTLAFVLAGCHDDDDDDGKQLGIVTQPADVAVLAGQAATFTVVAEGNSPTYQWSRNGAAITGATSASYTTPATVAGDSGAKYTVVVTSGSESLTSREATLTVNVPPSITTQPASASVTAGSTATFNVTAAGTGTLSYQWRRDGTAIAGATASAYTTAATVAGDDGAQFSVVVTSAYGTVTSNAATLTVTTPGSSFNGTWAGSAAMEATDNKVGYSTSAVNRETGDGIVAWVETSTTTRAVYVNEYTASTQTWRGATKLYEGPLNTTAIYNPDVAINPAGHAVVAWPEYDLNSQGFTRAVRRTPAGAWGSVVTVTSGTGSTDYVDVGIDAAGNATVGWVQGSPLLATVAYLPVAGGADAPVVLESSADSGRSEYMNVVVDDVGNVTAAWRRDRAGVDAEQVVARRRAAGQAWGSVVVLSETGRADYPDAAGDPVSGNVIVAWNDEAPAASVADIRYSVFNAASGTWSAADVAESETTDAGWVEVAASDGGFGAITWETNNGTALTIRARLVDLGTAALSAPVTATTDGAWPHVGVNATGDMMVAYGQVQSNYGINFAYYVPKTGTPSTTQFTPARTEAVNWNLAMTSAGATLLAWDEGFRDQFYQFTGTTVYARWFK